MRFLGLSALLFGMAALAAGCGGQGQAKTVYKDQHPLPAEPLVIDDLPETGTHGGRFVLAQTSSPRTFNVVMANETSSTDVTDGRLFTTLVDFNNGKQEITPWLASSWEISPDGRTSTWHLRRGAAFSDGHPITAEDVLFTFELYMDDTLHVSLYDFCKPYGQKFKLSAPDSYTVVIEMAGPYAMVVPIVASVYIMPKHVLEPAYRSGRFASAYNVNTPPESLVTSGPWKLKQYVPNEKTVLERNPYWCGVDAKQQRMPYLDELVFVNVPNQDTAALKFQAGEVDALDDVKPENYQTYTTQQKEGNFTLHDLGPSLNTNFFFFNLNRVHEAKPGKKLGAPQTDPVKYAWFSNPVFRKAVSKAVDRDAIIKSVYYGSAVKNWSIMTPGNKTWYTPEVVHFDYDPEGAKQLIASLGWKDTNGDGVVEDTQGHPVRFNLKTNSSNTMRVAAANFIKDDLKKIGIQVDVTPLEFNALITNLRSDFQYESISLGLQSATPPDPGMGQNVWRSSGLTHYWNIKQPKPENAIEATFDRLMTENVTTIDPAVRKSTFLEMQNLLNEQGFVIWLPSQMIKLPIRNRFGNLHPAITPHRLLWNIDRVFVKASQPRA
jgi:peptide/nickel transport system substrate-binding protein